MLLCVYLARGCYRQCKGLIPLLNTLDCYSRNKTRHVVAFEKVHCCTDRFGALSLFSDRYFQLAFQATTTSNVAHISPRASVSDSMKHTITHDTIYHRDVPGAVAGPGADALARTTRSGTRKVVAENTEALFHDVLRTCGSLVNEDTYGLSILDCARLAAVSKSCNAIVAANECWRDALCAVEGSFRFVPEDDRELEEGSVWREALGDPRYRTFWESSSPMQKFNLLLPYAQEIIAIMKRRSLDADRSDWDLDLAGLQRDLVEPKWPGETREEYEEQRREIRSVIHLLQHYNHRYDMLMKLVIAHRLQGGFEYGCYHVEDFFAGYVMRRDDEFGRPSSSLRDGNNELIYQGWIHCGDDAHLDALNKPIDKKLRQPMLGEKVYRSLQVLPLDLDAVGFEVLAKDPQTLLMLREMYLERLDDNLTVDDFEDWRDIWPWRNYDQPGQGGTSDESDADESDEDESDDDT
jgi:hypothetical protein